MAQHDDIDEDAPTLMDSGLREELMREELTRALSLEDLAEITPAPSTMPSGAPVDPNAWFLGRSFGGFRMVCALASGGMATVFLARKEGPARVSKFAAIKVVHPHLAFERDFVNMFLDEARIAGLIDHPNVCSVLDFGMAEGTYYLAMEYLLGETWNAVRAALAEHPEGARILPAITAYVLSQACEGLHAAHEAIDEHGRPLRIVHRDVSPQNIFVAYDGTVRVLDFGIASAADRITSTRDGTLKGRLAYMSPEQMSVSEVGPAADIWSMGVVLREALEGKRLFRRSSDAETMLAVTNDPLPQWGGSVPLALRHIADRALTREPEARFANAHEMGIALSRFAHSARNPMASSELSVWMGLLFAAQMEQKRALLQLSIPTPADDAAPWPAALLPHEPSTEPSLSARGPSTIPARGQGRRASTLRPRWVNVSALLALASVGAIAGLVLGHVARKPRAHVETPVAAPSVSPLPTVAQLPSSAASPSEPGDRAEPAEASGNTEAPPRSGSGTSVSLATATETGTEADSARARNRTGHSRHGDDSEPASTSAPEAHATAASPALDQGTRMANTGPEGAEEGRHGRRATSTSPEAGSGTVAVAFEGGWAEVYLGARLLGTTPGRFTLPAGKQTLTVRPFGTGKPFAKRVEVVAGAAQKLFLGSPSL
jgi:serine/threonine-protein kinase